VPATAKRSWWLPALIGALTAVGFFLRLADFDQSLFADELSTYWIVHGHSLGDVLSSVRSTDEITPPLFFVFAWFSLKIGSGPEWLRLPSLLAGTLTIPLVYLVGRRTVGQFGGVVAAALTALSPFMIYYSTEARSYALMIAFVTASTLALLIAVEDGRVRWWALYAVCSAAAMLSHYTAVFPLAAQFLWALWAHRGALRGLLLANLGALALFAPWIPGFVADNNSPTTTILSALTPFSAGAVKTATETWAYGYQNLRADYLPGNLARLLIAASVAIALAALTWHLIERHRTAPERLRAALRKVPRGPVLVVMLALATPLGEIVFSAVGTNIYSARNLNASWPGLALTAGGLVASAGPLLGPVCAGLLLTGFSIGAVKALGSGAQRPDYQGIAARIERQAKPGDVVIDAAAFTPVPQTALDLYLPQTRPEFRLGMPVTDHPFNIFDRAPDPDRQIRSAFAAAKGRALFVITPAPGGSVQGAETGLVADIRRSRANLGSKVFRHLPAGFHVAGRRDYPGLGPLALFVIRDRSAR
jgi:hypothetical protein